MNQPTTAPTTPPTVALAAVVAAVTAPTAPTDWAMATALPAATLPPLATAADDIKPAAMLFAAKTEPELKQQVWIRNIFGEMGP